jgi:hypothetical protein
MKTANNFRNRREFCTALRLAEVAEAVAYPLAIGIDGPLNIPPPSIDSRDLYYRRPTTRTMAVRRAPLPKAAAHWLRMARQSSKPLRAWTVN